MAVWAVSGACRSLLPYRGKRRLACAASARRRALPAAAPAAARAIFPAVACAVAKLPLPPRAGGLRRRSLAPMRHCRHTGCLCHISPRLKSEERQNQRDAGASAAAATASASQRNTLNSIAPRVLRLFRRYRAGKQPPGGDGDRWRKTSAGERRALRNGAAANIRKRDGVAAAARRRARHNAAAKASRRISAETVIEPAGDARRRSARRAKAQTAAAEATSA